MHDHLQNRRFAQLHPLTCECPRCREDLQQQHMTRDAPMSTLPDSTVSVRELLDYKVLEDWSDD